MKKILFILAILMVSIAGKAEDITVEKTDFSGYTEMTYGMSYILDSNISVSIYSNLAGGVTASTESASIKYTSQCKILLGTASGSTLKSVEFIFADVEHSPGNASNGCDVGKSDGLSTSGMVVSDNKVTYEGEGTSVCLCCQTTDNQKREVTLTGIKVVYENMIHVHTAEEFAAAVKTTDTNGNYNAGIRLMQDIDISGLTETTDGYLFKLDGGFCGSITGENTSGDDYALKNSTHPLFYHTSGANISHLILNGFNVSGATSLIARTSSGSTFSHLTVKYSSLNAEDAGQNTGMIAGYSDTDTFEYCSVWEGCSVESEKEHVGGIAGFVTKGSTFTYCRNSGTVKSTIDSSLSTANSYVGGIVGYADQCKIERCLNTGITTADNYEGGIVGGILYSSIKMCVNTAFIKACHSKSYRRAGIAGEVINTDMYNCMNFGDIDRVDFNGKYEITNSLIGPSSSGGSASDNIYYAQVDGKRMNNLSSVNTTYEEILSGKYAYTATNIAGEKWLYQDIDNNTFCTKYPVPLPEAGVVYSNILCDGTQSYSNKYKSTGSHTGVADQFGRCTICGKVIGTVASEVHIKDAAGLISFAEEVNSNSDSYYYTVFLDNDIDMNGQSYTPIGNSSHPFSGEFDGQGHHIKNLVVEGTSEPVGLFGSITDSYIENVVVDNTCTFSNACNGTAGVVGCVTKPASGTDCHVSIKNCGNEAAVSSTGANAGGILGGVYENDNTEVYIYNCYNTGAVTGKSASAAIVGFARKYTYMRNCWNSGSVTGVTDDMSLWYTNASGSECTATDCYDINKQPGTTTLTAEDLALGVLCSKINITRAAMNNASFAQNPYSAWTQNIGTDAYPTFGDDGIHHLRTMTNEWGTICLPYAIENGDDYDLYTLSNVTKDALSLTKVSGSLAAGTPAIVRRNASAKEINVAATGSTFVTAPVTGSSANGLTLTGEFDTTEITTENGYIIANNAFWNIQTIKGDNKVYCDAFRSYLAGTLSNGAKQLSINFDDDSATGINTLSTCNGAEVAYDLNGRCLNSLLHGMNIVRMADGTTKKVIKK